MLDKLRSSFPRIRTILWLRMFLASKGMKRKLAAESSPRSMGKVGSSVVVGVHHSEYSHDYSRVDASPSATEPAPHTYLVELAALRMNRIAGRSVS